MDVDKPNLGDVSDGRDERVARFLDVLVRCGFLMLRSGRVVGPPRKGIFSRLAGDGTTTLDIVFDAAEEVASAWPAGRHETADDIVPEVKAVCRRRVETAARRAARRWRLLRRVSDAVTSGCRWVGGSGQGDDGEWQPRDQTSEVGHVGPRDCVIPRQPVSDLARLADAGRKPVRSNEGHALASLELDLARRAVRLSDVVVSLAVPVYAAEATRVGLEAAQMEGRRLGGHRRRVRDAEGILDASWRCCRRPLRDAAGDLILRRTASPWTRHQLPIVFVADILDRLDADPVGERDGLRTWHVLFGPPGEVAAMVHSLEPAAVVESSCGSPPAPFERVLRTPARGGQRRADLGPIAAGYVIAALEAARQLEATKRTAGWVDVEDRRRACAAALASLGSDGSEEAHARLAGRVTTCHEALAALPPVADIGPSTLAEAAASVVFEARGLGETRIEDRSDPATALRRVECGEDQRAAFRDVADAASRRRPGAPIRIVSRLRALLAPGLLRLLDAMLAPHGLDVHELALLEYVPTVSSARPGAAAVNSSGS